MAFGALLGALAPSLIGGGISLLGGSMADKQRQGAVDQATAASQPVDVFGPLGSARFQDGALRLNIENAAARGLMNRSGEIGLENLEDLGSLDFEGREASELERLRTLRRPQINQARAALQSRLLARGRTGLGVGGGLSGRLFNPEIAGLEEAILRSDLGDIGAARTMSQQDQQFLLGQTQGLAGLQQNIAAGPRGLAQLGIQSRLPQSIAQMQALPGLTRADRTAGFFSGLGNAIGGMNFGGIGGGIGQTLSQRSFASALTGQQGMFT